MVQVDEWIDGWVVFCCTDGWIDSWLYGWLNG